jgi:hypothetical protein
MPLFAMHAAWPRPTKSCDLATTHGCCRHDAHRGGRRVALLVSCRSREQATADCANGIEGLLLEYSLLTTGPAGSLSRTPSGSAPRLGLVVDLIVFRRRIGCDCDSSSLSRLSASRVSKMINNGSLYNLVTSIYRFLYVYWDSLCRIAIVVCVYVRVCVSAGVCARARARACMRACATIVCCGEHCFWYDLTDRPTCGKFLTLAYTLFTFCAQKCWKQKFRGTLDIFASW